MPPFTPDRERSIFRTTRYVQESINLESLGNHGRRVRYGGKRHNTTGRGHQNLGPSYERRARHEHPKRRTLKGAKIVDDGNEYDAIVIGLGTAGGSVLWPLHQAGMKVAAVERELVGGLCA